MPKHRARKAWEVSSQFPNPKFAWIIPKYFICIEFGGQISCFAGQPVLFTSFVFLGETGLCVHFRASSHHPEKDLSVNMQCPCAMCWAISRSVILGTWGYSKFFRARGQQREEGPSITCGKSSQTPNPPGQAGPRNPSPSSPFGRPSFWIYRKFQSHISIFCYFMMMLLSIVSLFFARNGLLLWNKHSSSGWQED